MIANAPRPSTKHKHVNTLGINVTQNVFNQCLFSCNLSHLFCPFLIPISITISIQIEKSKDGVLGIRTRGLMMVGVDDDWYSLY